MKSQKCLPFGKYNPKYNCLAFSLLQDTLRKFPNIRIDVVEKSKKHVI
jgi:hypothetical protein